MESLEHGNHRLQLALDCAELGTWSLDLKSGRFENDARDRHIHGHGPDAPPQTLVQMRSQVHPDDLSNLDSAFAGLARAGGSCRTEYRLAPRTDQERAGRERWVAIEGTVVRRADGRPVQLLGVTRDITERKHAEAKLQESERASRELLGALPAAIYVTDGAGRITYCNEGAVNLWGARPQLGVDTWSDLSRFYHANGTPMALEDCPTEIALTQGRSVRGREAILERLDGTRVPIAPHPTPLRDGTGAVAGVINMTVDISERKKAELALAERDAQLTLAGRSALIASYAYDVGSDRMQVSEGYAVIHGLTEGTTETTRSQLRARAHPEDVERFEKLRSQAFRRRQAEYNIDYRIVLPNRGIRWIESRSFISYDDDGRPLRVVGVNIDVTRRRQTEQALADRNNQLELAGKAALVGSFAVSLDVAWEDITSQRIQISPGYAVIHGLPEGTEEISVSDWRSQVHPDDLPQYLTRRHQALADRCSEQHSEYRIVRSDGEIRWIESRSFISYDGAGRAQRMVGVNIDISERKRTEQALADRNAQFELAHKAARVGSYAYDNTKHVMRLSRASAAIYGLSQGTIEITGKAWRDRIHRDDVDRLRAERLRAFEARQPEIVGEFRIVRPGGEVRWIEARTLISYDSAGRASRMIGVYIDVTERMRAERTLLERDAQLDLANQIGRVGGYSYDYTTNTLRLGAGTAAIYGLPESAEEMTAEEWRRCVHPGDLGQLAAETRRALAQQQSELICVFRIIRNGEVRWIETRNRFSYDKTGRAAQAIGVSIDVTERRQAEDQKSLLIAELDHRVKNMLACVVAVAQRTREAAKSMDEFLDVLDGRIHSLANAHTLLSRSRWQGVNLAELVRGELAPCGKNNNTHVAGPEISLGPEAAQTMAMVLHELATNSAKYGALSVKGGRVSVRWRHRQNGHAQSWLSIQWEESGGPNVVPATRSGYGTSVICDLIPYELGGTVDLVHASEGVRCRMEFPAHWLSSSHAPSDLSTDQPEASSLFQTGRPI